MTNGRDLPWLQDADQDADGLSDVWAEQWDVTFRDVIVVDSENRSLGTFNLTDYDLAEPPNYELLRRILVNLAEDAPLWQNQANPFDVNGDAAVSPAGDILPCINEINNREFSDPASGQLPGLPLPPHTAYVDVNGDGNLSPAADILPIINHINSRPNAEGEAGYDVFHGAAAFDGDGEVLEFAFPGAIPRATEVLGHEGSSSWHAPPGTTEESGLPEAVLQERLGALRDGPEETCLDDCLQAEWEELLSVLAEEPRVLAEPV